MENSPTSIPATLSAALISRLQNAQHIAVMTGAGVSAESGIPTFRDALTGLWQHCLAEDLATPEAFLRDPPLVWGWYEGRRAQLVHCLPNPGHVALAKLAQCVPRFTLITQNVDDLHERAGSGDVLHLHGSLQQARCFDCGLAHPHGPAGVHHQEKIPPPVCKQCGGPVRPGVV